MDAAASLADYQRGVLRAAFRAASAVDRAQGDDAAARRPLLLPWSLVPSLVLPALLLTVPAHGPSTTAWLARTARVPLAVLVAALNLDLVVGFSGASTASLNLASAYGAGLLAAWGTLWAWVLLVWTEPQRDAARVERRRKKTTAVDADDDAVAVTATTAVCSDPHAPAMVVDADVTNALLQGFEYYWQAFPADAPFLARLDWVVDLCFAWRGCGWNWSIAQIPRFQPPPPEWPARLLGQAQPGPSQQSQPLSAPPLKPPLVRLASLRQVAPLSGVRRECTHAAFFWTRARTILLGYLVLDVCAVLMTQDPYFVLGPPPDRFRPWSEQTHALPLAAPASQHLHLLPPPLHLLALPPYLQMLHRHPLALATYRGALGMAGILAGIVTFLSAEQAVHMLVFGGWWPGRTATQQRPRHELWQYPSIFGSFDCVLDGGLAGFWGAWWHQTFRMTFVAPTAWMLRRGWLAAPAKPTAPGKPRPTTAQLPIARAVRLLVAFVQSSLLHAAGSLTSLPTHTQWWQAPLFFVLSGVGMAVQDALAAAMHRAAGSHTIPRTCCRLANFAFVVLWLLATGHLFIDDMCRAGIWLFEPVPFSVVRWLLSTPQGQGVLVGPASSRAGQAAWRWYADDVMHWHAGRHWWDSGLAV